ASRDSSLAAEEIFRAGAAAVNVDPPLGLPMMGVVRRDRPAEARLGPLEVTAAAFERGPTRVIVCGVDTLAIQSPEGDRLRERNEDGRVTRIGWNPGGLVDLSVPVLQAVRSDGSAIATVVGYGCHTVTTGISYVGYSPDYPGPLRDLVRSVTGGECVFLQGAAGNVMPRFAFDDENREPSRLGRRLALEALHALADRPGWPSELVETSFGSGTVVLLFRNRPVDAEPPALGALEARVGFPLLPLPTLDEIRAERERAERELQAAEQRGASEPELRI